MSGATDTAAPQRPPAPRSRSASAWSRRSSSTSSGRLAGHDLAEERLPGWVRPSNWYLTGFLVPVGRAGRAERAMTTPTTSSERCPRAKALRRRARARRTRRAKKGFFPSSIGLSALVPAAADELDRHRSLGRLQVRAWRGAR